MSTLTVPGFLDANALTVPGVLDENYLTVDLVSTAYSLIPWLDHNGDAILDHNGDPILVKVQT